MELEHIERLRRVADRIEAEPQAYAQDDWFGIVNPDFDPDDCDYDEDARIVQDRYFNKDEFTTEAALMACQTTACIGGHIAQDFYQSPVYEIDVTTPAWHNGNDYYVCLTYQPLMKTQFIGAMVGLSLSESIHLFDSDWQPRGCNEDTSHEVKAKLVAEALRAIADGEKVLNV